jgi:signal recognition particle subunit SRP54
MAMIPGFNANFMGAGNDKNSALTVKRYITIIESMTEKELDSTNVKIFADERRIMRLARGSGRVLLCVGGGA